jgi:hypothetical protein
MVFAVHAVATSGENTHSQGDEENGTAPTLSVLVFSCMQQLTLLWLHAGIDNAGAVLWIRVRKWHL